MFWPCFSTGLKKDNQFQHFMAIPIFHAQRACEISWFRFFIRHAGSSSVPTGCPRRLPVTELMFTCVHIHKPFVTCVCFAQLTTDAPREVYRHFWKQQLAWKNLRNLQHMPTVVLCSLSDIQALASAKKRFLLKVQLSEGAVWGKGKGVWIKLICSSSLMKRGKVRSAKSRC